ncbi:MAG: Fic family protein [Candidatus Omnitrophota bacterium]
MNTNINEFINKFSVQGYLSKEEIGYRLPNELSLEEFWQEAIKFRKQKSEGLPFIDQNNQNFWYFLTPILQKRIYEIDSSGKDSLYRVVKKEIENELVKDSLIEEALYSSVIEGAFSTMKRLRELVEEKKSPIDINDQMVLNNYKAMQFILQEKHRELSLDFILQLHKIVTKETLFEDEAYAGRFRDDMVYIKDKRRDIIIYTPPKAEQIEPAMRKLVEWVNSKDDERFIHPIIRASFIHFYFVYIHPFFDGNGRTARALFYYFMIKHGYEFFKYFSISAVVQKTKIQYYRAIKDVEDCNADLTYFLLYLSDTILESMRLVSERIAQHYQREFVFVKLREKGILLNERQDKFLKKFLVSDKRMIIIKAYEGWFKVVYETARHDLEDLVVKGILVKSKHGRQFVYKPNYQF